MILQNILLFLLGLLLLVKGSGYFVKSAAAIAKKFGVSEFVVGLTLVALGTSIPELASAIFASIKHAGTLVLGNITGANIANICLITGTAAAITSIKTNEDMLKRDGYILLFSSFVLLIFIRNGVISTAEGLILLSLYAAYILFLVEDKPESSKKYHFREFMHYFIKFKYISSIKKRLAERKTRKKQDLGEGIALDFAIMAAGGAAVAYGASLFVNSAIYFAEILSLPKAVVGVSIVAIGTTLPELSVTISAARKGFGNIALGNVIGSCITNAFLILGVSSVISPIHSTSQILFLIAPFLIFANIMLLAFLKSNWEIRRFEGFVFLAAYLFFMALLFIKSGI
jgi:cation:H+ antiporter